MDDLEHPDRRRAARRAIAGGRTSFSTTWPPGTELNGAGACAGSNSATATSSSSFSRPYQADTCRRALPEGLPRTSPPTASPGTTTSTWAGTGPPSAPSMGPQLAQPRLVICGSPTSSWTWPTAAIEVLRLDAIAFTIKRKVPTARRTSPRSRHHRGPACPDPHRRLACVDLKAGAIAPPGSSSTSARTGTPARSQTWPTTIPSWSGLVMLAARDTTTLAVRRSEPTGSEPSTATWMPTRCCDDVGGPHR